MHPTSRGLAWTIIAFLAIATFLIMFGLLRSIFRRKLAATFFSGKHVWITGASSGIGKELAVLLVARGAKVTLSARSREKLEVLATHLNQLRDGISAVVPLDVTSRYEKFLEAHKAAHDAHGAVDVLFANAGVNNGGNFFAEISADVIDQVVSTNYRGTVYSVKAVLPSMLERCQGTICTVSSLSAYRGLPRGSVYGGTKAAITNFTESLRVELWNRGIKVVCVHPGFVDTPALGEGHKTPFCMSAAAAAESILEATAAGCASYGFPLVMEHVLMRIAQVLPAALYDPILKKLGD